ncbi:MAG TPA: DNA polymerase III subunit delta' C-terminal domain-containing protein [Balneolales bacterium]|nr:DNA polymerase III subunit delta' C-terminal domain-containing protein [Balneolales bacterium]
MSINLGSRRIVGQEKVREQLSHILESKRIGHAYLFTGPPGIGKKALALAFAEAINGIDHLSDLKGDAISKKSSWYTHPDIRIFLPIPTNVSIEELKIRTELLAKDPYEIVDFGLRPSLTDGNDLKNRKAFYSIGYFNEQVRPAAFLKPNEAPRNIVIISNIEKMEKPAANAFLKLLEEPSENLMFLLTTDKVNALLPTIISRCQIVSLSPLSVDEVHQGLMEKDGLSDDDARYLARISGGNYAKTRFYDMESLKSTRQEILSFLRAAYAQDAVKLTGISNKWNAGLNLEGQQSLLNMLEVFLRDLVVYRSTRASANITNIDQIEVIKKFNKSLNKARLESMIDEINDARRYLYQNVQAKLIFTVLAIHYSYLMRGIQPPISDNDAWRHIPALKI